MRTISLNKLTTGLILLLLIFYIRAEGQKHDNVWLFGKASNNGGINGGEYNLVFTVSPPSFILDFKPANFGSYSVSICDSVGQLLFYSDGLKLWNSNHIVIENGIGLNPGEWADAAINNHISYPIAASGQIIKIPGKQNQYLLLHISIATDEVNDVVYHDRLYYTKIDMSSNGGEGTCCRKKCYSQRKQPHLFWIVPTWQWSRLVVGGLRFGYKQLSGISDHF